MITFSAMYRSIKSFLATVLKLPGEKQNLIDWQKEYSCHGIPIMYRSIKSFGYSNPNTLLETQRVHLFNFAALQSIIMRINVSARASFVPRTCYAQSRAPNGGERGRSFGRSNVVVVDVQLGHLLHWSDHVLQWGYGKS